MKQSEKDQNNDIDEFQSSLNKRKTSSIMQQALSY
jgi:hypothetical protein